MWHRGTARVSHATTPQGRGALRVPGEGQIGCPTPQPRSPLGSGSGHNHRATSCFVRSAPNPVPVSQSTDTGYSSDPRAVRGRPRPPEVCCLLTAGFGCEVGTLATIAFVWKRAAGLPARRAGFCWMRHRIWLRATCGQNRTAGFPGEE